MTKGADFYCQENSLGHPAASGSFPSLISLCVHDGVIQRCCLGLSTQVEVHNSLGVMVA